LFVMVAIAVLATSCLKVFNVSSPATEAAGPQMMPRRGVPLLKTAAAAETHRF
jgi:hypothetical protein